MDTPSHRFAFQDGIIGELCPNETETNWVINFKRGILSSLQNSMQRLDIDHKTKETDISGTCDVNYVVNGASETSLIIQKHKDISTCQNRYKTNSILQTTPYDFRKHYTAWPVLQSTSYCNVCEFDFFLFETLLSTINFLWPSIATDNRRSQYLSKCRMLRTSSIVAVLK